MDRKWGAGLNRLESNIEGGKKIMFWVLRNEGTLG